MFGISCIGFIVALLAAFIFAFGWLLGVMSGKEYVCKKLMPQITQEQMVEKTTCDVLNIVK